VLSPSAYLRLADLGAHPSKVLKAAGGLREAGLLTESLELDRDALRAIAKALPRDGRAGPAVVDGPWGAEEAENLGRFFSGIRLVQIPASRGKRRIVLERLAMEFEPGLRYPEKEVNLILEAFHADYTSLRRYLDRRGVPQPGSRHLLAHRRMDVALPWRPCKIPPPNAGTPTSNGSWNPSARPCCVSSPRR
jgi:hypothetical protein